MKFYSVWWTFTSLYTKSSSSLICQSNHSFWLLIIMKGLKLFLLFWLWFIRLEEDSVHRFEHFQHTLQVTVNIFAGKHISQASQGNLWTEKTPIGNGGRGVLEFNHHVPGQGKLELLVAQHSVVVYVTLGHPVLHLEKRQNFYFMHIRSLIAV